MMLSRAAPSAAGPAMNSPRSSGPRWRSVAIMRDSRAGSGRSAFSERNPAIPHIGLGMGLFERPRARLSKNVLRQLSELPHRVFVARRRRRRIERDLKRGPDIALDVVAGFHELPGVEGVGEHIRVIAALRIAFVILGHARVVDVVGVKPFAGLLVRVRPDATQ